MDFGYCGVEDADPCLTFAQGLGSFLLILIIVFASIAAAFVVIRLVYLAFHFPQYPTKNELADKLTDDDYFIMKLSEKVAAEQARLNRIPTSNLSDN